MLWVVTCAALWTSADNFENVVVDGEFAYLPDSVPSRRAEDLYDRAFGSEVDSDDVERDLVRSSIVLVVRRRQHPDGLLPRDREFVEEVVRPKINEIAESHGGLAQKQEPDETDAAEDEDKGEAKPKDGEAGGNEPADEERTPSIIAQVRTPSDKSIGELLLSEDGKAALVVVELTTEFLEEQNHPLVAEIEQLVDDLTSDLDLRREWDLGGLEITVSGIAVAGRDMRQAAEESGQSTETWTVLLVVILLILIYRAPILALLPLMTVFLSVRVALGVLSILASGDLINLFSGVKVYVVVILYGAGVDYCLFLIARYKEELDAGASTAKAIENSIGRVGAALAASASTTMCGIGMMYFADFGKFSQAGIAIPLSLAFVLLASLTFTPAMLLVMGRWAFWPHVSSDRLPARSGWISPTSLVSRILESELFTRFWERMARALEARPATYWLATVACMLPFAVVGLAFYDHLSYGLLSELSVDSPSVVGAEAVQDHFPAGMVGPVTVLLHDPDFAFAKYRENDDGSLVANREKDGYDAVEKLTANIAESAEELRIADVRSLTSPLGLEHPNDDVGLLERRVRLKGALEHYVSPVSFVPEGEEPQTILAKADGKVVEIEETDSGETVVVETADGERVSHEVAINDRTRVRAEVDDDVRKGDVLALDEYRGNLTRIDVVFRDDPFSRHSIEQFERFQNQLPDMLPEELAGAELQFLGATASIRDLKVVTDGDQIKVDVIVSLAVFLILVVLLGRRQPALVFALVAAHFVWMSVANRLGIQLMGPLFWTVDLLLVLPVVLIRGRASSKSAYLMLSVLFSYFVTLGVTFSVFYLADPAGFSGLDWKVPMFLFTILVAVGQDYNIYFVTRVEEEQEQHGPVDGIGVALARTGGIISSCGLIMAGTFSSLLAGTLVGMQQLGFALAFGVLLDTFVVRPVLVPAYLIMLHAGRFGAVGRYLGAQDPVAATNTPQLEATHGSEG